MFEKSNKKEHHQSRNATASGEKNTLLISSKLMADLKNKGILAFKQMSEDEQRNVWDWAKAVIQQYRRLLDTDLRNIRNIEELPFSKEDIKLAIKLSLPLYLSKDMQSAVKKLKNAYKDIGTFQVIEETDKKALSTSADPKHSVSSQNGTNTFSLSDKYAELSISEQKALLQEINDFVADLETGMQNNRSER